MNKILDNYLNSDPEIVFEWRDKETEAQGWLVINSLRNGAAGGGTRMREGLTKEEVISLAKVMGIKFSVCGPHIGGAKSGINFNPSDPRKMQVLERWFKAIRPLLKNYYGTGGDLNVDEVKEVFPITEKLGIMHPQEGVLNGFFSYSEITKQKILTQLDKGCKLPVVSKEYAVDTEGRYNVADMITGYGVAESIRHYCEIFQKNNLDGKRCLIQGWGNVASAAAFYLARQGAKIVGILDRNFSLVSENGFSLEEIVHLFLNKKGNQLNHASMVPNHELLSTIWDNSFDIFVPAAASRIVHFEEVNRMINKGLDLVSCGANVPFLEDKIVFGDTSKKIDQRIGLIPDFIANCGMARTFNYLMHEESEISEKAIFEDVSQLIRSSLLKVYPHCEDGKSVMNSALSLYLN